MAIQGNAVQGMSQFGQALAGVPEIPLTKRGLNDGLVSSGTDAEPLAFDENGVRQTPTLATVADPTLLFRTVDGLVRSQDRIAQNRWAIDLHFRRVRANVPFSYLEKIPNQAIYVSKMPNGITRERAGSVPNKADDLCNKVEAALLADPAKPNPQPHVTSESADQASELAAEYLRLVSGESGINWLDKHHWALNVALTCGSAFLLYDVDMEGGGYQPLQVLAHPQAQDPANPTAALAPDPMTGQMVQQPAVDPVLRYVSPPTPEAPSGQFVEQAAQADKVWLPAPVCERIRREQVRLFPPTADIESADMAVVLMWDTLARGRKRFPETVGQMSAGDLQGLAAWRPAFGQDLIVPFMLKGGLADGSSGPSVDEVGSASPLLQRRFFWYRAIVKKSREYPQGFWLDISGYQSGLVLKRDTLEYTVTLPKGGETTRCRDIPLEQIRPVQDAEGGDPMGWPFMARIAGASDAEQMLYSAYQDAINLRLNPHVFIRSAAAVDDDDWADRSKPIILNPNDPEPTYEDFSPLPGEFLPMIQNVDRKMDSAAMLGETAQGLETDTAVSGVAKQITVQQANRDLSGMLFQLNSGQTRGWRILLQIAQAFFSVPQLISYTGESGSAEPQWWTGQDLAGVDDVGIEPGTGSMMTPEGKAQLVAFAQGQGWLSVQESKKAAMGGITRDLGLPDDPVDEAIEREVAAWFKGPPEGWTPARPQLDPMTQQPVVNPQTGQPMLSAPSFTPFTPRPNDTEPTIAQRRMERLSLAQMSPEYTRFDPNWRSLLDTAYMTARQSVATAQAAAAQAGKPQAVQPSGHAPTHGAPASPVQGASAPALPKAA